MNLENVAIGSTDGMRLWWYTVYSTILNSDIKVITAYRARKIEKLVSSKIKRGAWKRIR